MYGAILGDMIGAPYEFDRGDKTKDFPLFIRGSQFTDDSVMSIAVAEALLDTMGQTDDEVKAALVQSMQTWGRKYPHAGYGGRFRGWLSEKHPEPYGSYGNGSAMRVSSAGWLYPTLDETRYAARLTAEVTHNHPEGIKGAEATASAIFLARTGKSKDEIQDYIVSEFGYDLSRTCDEIRPTYHHVESCQKYNGPSNPDHPCQDAREHGILSRQRKERIPWHTDSTQRSTRRRSFWRFSKGRKSWARLRR
ncbi:MAG: ADP-ribosylglycohydrolase family protein, partial [Oscillospiraceae bacterium]|nr:ADP-ribosylglycohydrolase family protein [Oscillospiraceae bacterium]